MKTNATAEARRRTRRKPSTIFFSAFFLRVSAVAFQTGGMMRVLMIIVAVSLCGCAGSYVTPGRGAQLADIAAPAAKLISPDSGVREAIDRKPMANFPAAIAVVRVQAPNYKSSTAAGF